MTTLQLLYGFLFFLGGMAGAFAALFYLGSRRIDQAEKLQGRYFTMQDHLDDELTGVPESEEISRYEFDRAFDPRHDPLEHLPETLQASEETERARDEVGTDFSIEPD